MEMSPNVKEAQLWLLSDILQEEDNNMPSPFNDIGKRNVVAPQVPSQGFGYPVRQDLMTVRSSFRIPNRSEAPFSDQNRVQSPIGGFNEQRFWAPVDMKEIGVGGGRKSIGTGVFIPTARGTPSSRHGRQFYRVKNDVPPPVQEESAEESVDVSPELCLPPEWTY